jgi:hypothetical protein
MSKKVDENFVVAKNFPMRPLAEAGQELLEQENIPCILQSTDRAGAGTGGGCDIYVRAQDLERAMELLETFFDSI